MTTVFPTHTCFDDCVEIMAHILKAHPDALTTDEFVIVHGIVNPHGEELAHGWIEATRQDKVIFIGIINGVRKILAAERADYYADIKVLETTRYTFLAAYREEKRTGMFGPWVERYRQLSGRDKGRSQEAMLNALNGRTA